MYVVLKTCFCYFFLIHSSRIALGLGMERLHLWLVLVSLIVVASSQTLAAALPQARVASYAGYTRLVFDVPDQAEYTIEPLGAALRVTLIGATTNSGVVRVGKPEVSGYTLESGSGNAIILIVTPQGVATRRGFRVQKLEPNTGKTGFRLVLDFSGAFSDISKLPAVAALRLQNLPAQPYTVLLDPGHGGPDSGALGKDLIEAQLNLEVSFRIRKWLEDSGVKVELTRTSNQVFSSNKEKDLRARAAASRGKNVFVSVHANARPRNLWNSTFGMEVYYFNPDFQRPLLVTPAPEPQAAEPQAAESRVEPTPASTPPAPDTITKPETPVSAIATTASSINSNGFGTWQPIDPSTVPETATPPAPIPVQQNRTDASKELAVKVLAQMLGATAAFNRGVQTADYYVIKNSECPAILIEMGFVTHPIEGVQLKNSNYLDRISYGVAVGILEYLDGLASPLALQNLEQLK